MSKPRQDTAYQDGVEQFLTFAYRDIPRDSEILCPCKKCKNRLNHSHDEVRTHLRCDGIIQGYTTWVHHGEMYESPQFAFVDVPTDTTNLPTSGVSRAPAVQDGMQELLQAAFFRNEMFESLPSMSEGVVDVESGFADMEQTVAEDVHPADDNAKESEQNLYERYLKDAHTSLYPGCKFSKLSFLVNLYHLKCLNGWTQESFTRLLGVLSDSYPPHVDLPKTYYQVKRIIRALGLDYVKIHACPKDCMLFRGSSAKKDFCDVCQSSRWKDFKKNGSTVRPKKKKKPAKVLRYFPLIPRLQRLFSTTKTSEDMRWHEDGRTKDGKMRHPADGEAWEDFNRRYPKFAADARNVRLGLASDGFNPFGNMSSKHSTWPVMLVPYNLPPWICMKQTSLLLSMIIPGLDSPGNDVDIYLQPLIDELLELWKGVQTCDASSRKKFPLRAALLWTINDFPTLAYLYGWSTSGTYACPSCGPATKSFHLKNGKKMCYMGHRRWLPQNHIYRRQKNQFDGMVEVGLAPEIMSGTSILKMLEGRVFVLGKKDLTTKNTKGNNKGKKKGKQGDESHQKSKRKRGQKKQKDGNNGKKEKNPEDWLKKRSIFFQLPYWEKNKLRHNLDVMHLEKNLCDNLIGTLMDIPSKTKDGLKARLDLVELGIRHNLHPVVDNEGKQTVPDAPFTMSREKKEVLCSVFQNLRTPDGYASNISRCVNMKDCTLTGLKSHDNHVLLHDILPVALRSCYPSKDVMEIVIGISNFFKKLCSKVIDTDELQTLQESIVVTLCNMEKIFLPSFFTVTVHLMVHLVEEVRLGGPVHYRWMYPMERYVITFCRVIVNNLFN